MVKFTLNFIRTMLIITSKEFLEFKHQMLDGV